MTTNRTSPGPTMTEEGTELQPLLLDLLRLSLFAKHLHWNVTGPHFRSLHAMFDEFAESYRAWSDRLAERMRALGGFPDGRPRAIATAPDTHEIPAREVVGDEAVRRLLLPIEAVSSRVRAFRLDCDPDDPVTQDLLTSILGGLEHQSWMLRALR